jgi:alkanesulfonate monooxygenase SsuD/methylene tetrahydromethanopterin reductase-like flavin-dependent oxidoreductase (luciferase family)
MQYGFVLPVHDPKMIVELGAEVEAAGWDVVFIAEMIWGPDAWVALTGIAMRTTTLKLGTMLSPVNRMRPWKIASETATLDQISNGRVILAVGLGALDTGFAEFGEATDRKTRNELVDEGLELAQLLWKNQPFSFTGKHYQVDTTALPEGILAWGVAPVQQPRIPIWITGTWPPKVSMKRAVKFDGVLPNYVTPEGTMGEHSVEAIAAIKQYIVDAGVENPVDIVIEGTTPDSSPESIATVEQWRDAGGTWWIESPWSHENDYEFLRARIAAGPPRG